MEKTHFSIQPHTLLTALVLAAAFLLGPSVSPNSAATVRAQASDNQCGGSCKQDPSNLQGTCATGLICIGADLAGTGTCINPISATCSPSNPCCSNTNPTTAPTTGPIVTATPTPASNVTVNPTVTSVPPVTVDPGTPVVGDCSGDQAGVPDGVVDLRDFEHYRRELSGTLSTLACDFDASGSVDIIDFTNYLRLGFVGQ